MSPLEKVRERGLHFTRGALRLLSLETRGMHEAAYLLAIFAFGSQLLALIRDRLLAAVFGAGHTLDLYYAAFRVPDFMFATVASLFSLYALLPILTRLQEESNGAMISFLRGTLLAFFFGMSFISLVAYILAPELVRLIAPGIAPDPSSFQDLVLLMRILLLQPILLGASNTVASFTQLRHRFLLYSVSPLLYNLGIIIGAIVLYPHFGIAGLGWGVVLGAAMHMLVQLPYFFSERASGSFGFVRLIVGLKEVLTLSVPRTFALASTQISLLAITAMASFLTKGSIAVFTFAYNLQAVPLTIIGVSYSVAAFPTLARLHAQGAKEQFASYIEAALRHVVFWSVPCMVFVIVLRAQIVRSVLGAGLFDWTATRLTAAALALFIISLTAQSLTFLIARVYYASGNTRKPLYFGFADIGVSIASALLLVGLFNSSDFFREWIGSLLRVDDIASAPVLMLALGYALGSIAEFIIGYVYFVRDFSLSQAQLPRLAFETFGASVIGGEISYLALSFLGLHLNIETTIGIFSQGAIAGVLGIGAAAGVLYLLKNRELSEVASALVRKFRDTPKILAVEPSDVVA
jgi:putative peptidoglycan lipid II flippase